MRRLSVRARPQAPKMEKFNEQHDSGEVLAERLKLWESIVQDSIFSDEVKGQFLSVLQKRFGSGKPEHESVGDWIYYSISQLLQVVDKISKKKELSRKDLMSLFENLRDDIWQFYKKVNE